jgi:sarcosine oxidase subunit gamma
MSHRDAVWLAQPASGKRFGLKGPRAADTLRDAGLAVPDRPNTWAPLRAAESADSTDIVSRLGASEFFIEESAPASGIGALEELLGEGRAAAYPVLRQDFGLVLGGAAADEALAEVCNVNFRALTLEARPVVMTLMIGVAVVVLPHASGNGRAYRIWCDPSYGAYLWAELENIVTRIPMGRPQ